MDPRHVPASVLMRQAVADTRALVKIEVALARAEVTSDLVALRRTAIAAGIAGVCALLSVTLMLVALALAIELGALAPLVVGAILLVIAIATALFAYNTVPRKPAARTQQRVRADMKLMKEHVTT